MGHPTAGSAFESYPLQVYVLAGNVTNLNAGSTTTCPGIIVWVYNYLLGNQSLGQLTSSDPRQGFVNASAVPSNEWSKEAALIAA